MDIPVHAAIRFGLGPRLSEAPPADPHAWLSAQLAGPDPALATPGLTVAQALAALHQDHAEPVPPGTPTRSSVLATAETARLTEGLATTAAPLRERLVWFWANHFTISRKRVEGAVFGPYLREAIRPHVTGRFVDMLLAVMSHPAMLIYLDNAQSVGPDSVAGRKQHKGLNENLARECLELHTVGRGAGYTQADVTAFAAVLTGWSVEANQAEPGFVFREGAHQPGPKTVMGQTWPAGMAGGIAALTWLADHPATHHRLALALCTHFVADAPPAPAVRAVEASLRDTRGDLGAAARTLVAQPAAWQTPLGKLRTPFDYVTATVRALDLPANKRADMAHWYEQLGEPLLGAPLPNGWADISGPWSSGEALLRRADWAWAVAGRVPDRDPDAVLMASLGGLASAETATAVRRAGSRREALTLLLAAPEFQRR